MLWNQHSMRLVTEHNVVISKKERVREGVGEKKSWLTRVGNTKVFYQDMCCFTNLWCFSI